MAVNVYRLLRNLIGEVANIVYNKLYNYMASNQNKDKLPSHLREFEYVWSSDHAPHKQIFVVADHKRKLALCFYPAGGAPDLDSLVDSYGYLRKISLQEGYHIAAYHPSDAKIPIGKKTPTVLRNVFGPMLDMYKAELLLGPMFVITTSESIKAAVAPVKEFIIVAYTDDYTKGLNSIAEMLTLGDIRDKEDLARKKMAEIEKKTGVKVHFAHDN